LLDSRTPDAVAHVLLAFRRGLKDTGYVEGENVTILYRFAEDQVDRLPELAGDLIRRGGAVIVTAGASNATFPGKTTPPPIPKVLQASQCPVRLGLVSCLPRPGGNLTGFNLFNSELVAKRLALLHQLVPRAVRIAVLVNPADVTNTETPVRDAQAAARAIGL